MSEITEENEMSRGPGSFEVCPLHFEPKRHLRLLPIFLGLAVLILPTDSARAEAPLAPSGLLVELHPQPLAVEELAAPRLSWIVEDPRRGARQSAYQVLVATRPELLNPGQADVWDSGQIKDANNASVPYAGPPLKPATRYHWTVRTWDESGTPGPFAKPSTFGTALKDQWTATPVWAEPDNNWAFLRSGFTVRDVPIASATLYATGTSPFPSRQYVFRASINGEFVGVGPTRGYDDQVFYHAFDVAPLLKPGTNALGFLAFTTREQAVLAQLDIVYADGERQSIGTNTTEWKALSGASIFSDAGNAGSQHFFVPREYIRFDHWPQGFDRPEFDDSGWAAPVKRDEIKGLTGITTRNLELEVRKPVRVDPIGPGAYRLDFARTVVGGLRIHINGDQGRQLDLRMGEELNEDGSVRYRMRTNNHYQDGWTLADGPQTIEHFGYRVFRYAEVHGLPENFDIGNLVGVGLVYPFDFEAAAFSSSDPRLDELWEFCRHSVRVLNMEIYMDTPSRERLPYEGDAYLQQLCHYALDRDYTLARHSIEHLYFHFTWPAEWKLTSPANAWRDYLQTADERSARKHFDLLKDTKTVRQFMDGRNLVVKDKGGRHQANAWTDLVDWPASLRDGYVFSDVNTVINTYNFRALRDLGALAKVIGRDQDAADLTTLAGNARTAINRHLFDAEKNRYRDGYGIDNHALHASIFPLAYGVATEREAVAAEYLIERRIVGNIFSAAYQVEALFDLGHDKAAIDLLTTDDVKSWRNMIRIGAGSSMETWDPRFKPNTTYSHGAAASPVYLIPKGMFGIDALEPGHRRFSVQPRPGDLETASIRVPALTGFIEAAFTQADDTLSFQLTVPANTTAQLRLPANATDDIREGGKALADVPELGVMESGGGFVQLEVPGGIYDFSVSK